MLDRVQGNSLQPAVLKLNLPAVTPEGLPQVEAVRDALALSSSAPAQAAEATWPKHWEALKPDAGLLKAGAKGAQVTALQELLVQRGHLDQADGSFGPKTKAALKAFQAAHGLKDDGVAGPNTLRAAAILKTVAEVRDMAAKTSDKAQHLEASKGLQEARRALEQIPAEQRGDLEAAILAGERVINPWADPPRPLGEPELEDRLDQFNDVFGQEQVTWT